MKQTHHSSGFTLIELMIVVAIIGILAAVTYPSYLSSLQKSRAADAQGALVSFANAMEKHYVRQNSFLGAGQNDVTTGVPVNTGPPNATLFPSQAPLDGTVKYYNLTIRPGITANTFTLRADPINAQEGTGDIELDSTGARRWNKNNDTDFIDTGENTWEY